MVVETGTVKHGVALGLPWLLVGVDPIWFAIIGVGLLFGWLARVGQMVQKHDSAESIKRDIVVSLLIGGGNGLLATIIIFSLGLNYLQGVGVAFLCAFAGVRALDSALKWVIKKLMEDFK